MSRAGDLSAVVCISVFIVEIITKPRCKKTIIEALHVLILI